MSDPFIGEIRAVAFNYAPEGWTLCNGQLLQVSQYQALFALLSNRYGGDGVQTFGVPNLQGRGIVHAGTGTNLPAVAFGTFIGAPSVTLTTSMTPAHLHGAVVTDPGHTHSGTLPQHTHGFGIQCNDGSGGAPDQTSPAGNYLSSTVGIDYNIQSLYKDVNSAGNAANDGNYPYPVLSPTALYSSTANNSMGNGTTTPSAAGTAVPVGTSVTGVTVSVSSTPGPTAPVPTQSPAVGLYYIIALTGIWPPRC